MMTMRHVSGELNNLPANVPEALRIPSRRRRLGSTARRLAVITLLVGTGVVEKINQELQPSQVVASESNNAAGSNQISKHNKICFALSGYGLDLTKDYFNGLKDSLSPHCHMARIIYSNAGINTSEIADKVRDYINQSTDPTKMKEVALYGGSMGGLEAANVGADLLKNDKTGMINIPWIAMDSSPSSVADVKGLTAKTVAKVGSSFCETDMPIYGLRAPAAVIGELAWRFKRMDFPNITDSDEFSAYMNDVKYISSQSEPRRANCQLKKINTFAEEDNLRRLEVLKQHRTAIFYLRAENPEHDEIVDVDNAEVSFRRIFPGITVIPIPGARHASPNETPAAHNPVIESILKQVGNQTIEDRISDYEKLAQLEQSLGGVALLR